MKRVLIYLILYILGFRSAGQGSVYITQSSLLGSPQLIRQWKNY